MLPDPDLDPALVSLFYHPISAVRELCVKMYDIVDSCYSVSQKNVSYFVKEFQMLACEEVSYASM